MHLWQEFNGVCDNHTPDRQHLLSEHLNFAITSTHLFGRNYLQSHWCHYTHISRWFWIYIFYVYFIYITNLVMRSSSYIYIFIHKRCMYIKDVFCERITKFVINVNRFHNGQRRWVFRWTKSETIKTDLMPLSDPWTLYRI